MNRLIIIGNGFDMAHGLKTSYMDFINWYWEQRAKAFAQEYTNVSKDCLCTFLINPEAFRFYESWAYFNRFNYLNTQNGKDIIQYIKEQTDRFTIEYSPFFETILQSIETKGWVDIENDYYQLLTKKIKNPNCNYTIEELNEQLAFLQQKLIEYLNTISIDINYDKERKDISNIIEDFFNPADFAIGSKKIAMDYLGLDINISSIKEIHDLKELEKLVPQRIMLLSFNYTQTASLYIACGKDYGKDTQCNYIHGQLEDPEHIIFGYGDELDKSFQQILDMNDNRLLNNIKSVRYLETGHYRRLLEFLMAAPFQVFIMGHSCGNSDRTLLNTIFEHENCMSIKPFYHKSEDGKDNYMEITQNIYRNFTDMKLFRDRVVNKKRRISF